MASNIRMHQDITDEEVKQASEFVDAHHFIEQLLQGYENKVSEKGSTFLSGERQLIAFGSKNDCG